MICSFYDQGTQDVFDGKDTRQARRACPQSIWPVARRKLDQLNAAVSLVGPAAQPALTANWDVDARARRKDVGRALGNVDWNRKGLKIVNILRTPAGDSLILNGQIPTALHLSPSDSSGRVSRIPGGELAFDAVGHNLDLSKFQPLINPEKIRDLEGRLSIDAHARGTNDAPRLSGTISVREAQIKIVLAREVEAIRARADEESIRQPGMRPR